MFNKLKDNNLDLSLYIEVLEEADAELEHVNRNKYIFNIIEAVMHPDVSIVQLAVLNDLLHCWFGYGENVTLNNSIADILSSVSPELEDYIIGGYKKRAEREESL